MRIPPLGPALIGALLIAGSAPVARQPLQTGAAPAVGTGVIAGQVVDATSRRPVGGAVVTLALAGAAAPAPATPQPSAAQTRRAVAVANAEGRFVFRDLPAGAYTASSTVDGFVAGAFGRRRPGGPTRPITLTDGARVTDAVIPMWRLGAITGTVRDDRGEPIVGVGVWAMRRTLTNGRYEFSLNGGTVEASDDRGHFRLARLAPGTYAITIRTSLLSHPVAAVDAYQAAVTSGTAATMRRAWSETGVIQIEGPGVVVDDWQVSVHSGNLPPMPGPNGTLLVYPDVFFSNAQVLGDATLIALGSGETRAGIDMTLPLVAGVRVSGVLMAPDGPATGHGLRLTRLNGGDLTYELPVGYSMSDRRGRFAFHGVTAGDYAVQAYRVPVMGPLPPPPPAAGGLPVSRGEASSTTGSEVTPVFAETRISVGRTSVDGVSLSLQPGARVSGRIVFDGAIPLPPARLQYIAIGLRPVSGTVRAADVRVDADARFVTSGYPPGRYVFTLAVPPGPEWTLASVRIGDGDAAGQAFTLGTTDVSDVVVTFTDRAISLNGTVRAADSSTDPECTVVAYPADFDAWLTSGMSARRLATAAVSQNGTYDLRIPLPGDYIVVAVPPDVVPEVDREFVRRFGPNGVRVSLAAGETKAQPLTLRPGR